MERHIHDNLDESFVNDGSSINGIPKDCGIFEKLKMKFNGVFWINLNKAIILGLCQVHICYFAIFLEGDKDPPSKQSRLSKHERTKKEAEVCYVKGENNFKYCLPLA